MTWGSQAAPPARSPGRPKPAGSANVGEAAKLPV